MYGRISRKLYGRFHGIWDVEPVSVFNQKELLFGAENKPAAQLLFILFHCYLSI
jgi:hypothetical protein